MVWCLINISQGQIYLFILWVNFERTADITKALGITPDLQLIALQQVKQFVALYRIRGSITRLLKSLLELPCVNWVQSTLQTIITCFSLINVYTVLLSASGFMNQSLLLDVSVKIVYGMSHFLRANYISPPSHLSYFNHSYSIYS
jgi:hypothetical protein